MDNKDPEEEKTLINPNDPDRDKGLDQDLDEWFSQTMETFQTVLSENQQLSGDYWKLRQEYEELRYALRMLKADLQEPNSLESIHSMYELRFYIIDNINQLLNLKNQKE